MSSAHAGLSWRAGGAGKAGTFVHQISRAATGGSRRAADALRALEGLLIPPVTGAREPTNEDYRRIVLFVAAPAIGFFLPSLLLAGVPQSLWIPFLLLSVAAAAWISGTFLFVRRSATLLACLASGGNALIVAGLGLAFRGYYHEIVLLYVLLVAGHAVVHGLAPSLVAVAMGPVLVPYVLQQPMPVNWTDPFYTTLYLTGTALIPWVAWRLAQRRAHVLGALRRTSETERSRLAAILASMGDAVVAVDRNGAVALTNEAYDRLFAGVTAEPRDARGKRLPRTRRPAARAARGDSFSMAFTLTAADGERRWFEATGGPIASSEGVLGGVVVIRDITDRSMRRLQEEFMATASHELRTPVAALHGYLQLLERHLDPASGATVANYARSALSQTRRLGRLLDRLFDLARLQTGALDVDLRPLDLVPLVRGAVESAQTITVDQELHLAVEAESVRVLGDPGRLEEVVLNLLTNAITHAPESKRVDTRISRDGDRARVEIRDYGPGIPAPELARLFSRFPRGGRRNGRAGRGLGLGLYISRELVRAHEGTIEVLSEVGNGTIATIWLPILSATGPSTGRRGRPVCRSSAKRDLRAGD